MNKIQPLDNLCDSFFLVITHSICCCHCHDTSITRNGQLTRSRASAHHFPCSQSANLAIFHIIVNSLLTKHVLMAPERVRVRRHPACRDCRVQKVSNYHHYDITILQLLIYGYRVGQMRCRASCFVHAMPSHAAFLCCRTHSGISADQSSAAERAGSNETPLWCR